MNKTLNIVAWTLSIVAALLIIISGIFKLAGSPEVVDGLSKMGLASYISLFGIMEILFAMLFLYPKTIKIGFILISCYFAGAIATDLSHGGNILPPFIILSLVWIASFLRNQNIFLNTAKV